MPHGDLCSEKDIAERTMGTGKRPLRNFQGGTHSTTLRPFVTVCPPKIFLILQSFQKVLPYNGHPIDYTLSFGP